METNIVQYCTLHNAVICRTHLQLHQCIAADNAPACCAVRSLMLWLDCALQSSTHQLLHHDQLWTHDKSVRLSCYHKSVTLMKG